MTTSSLSICGGGEACAKHASIKDELIYLKAFEDGIHLNEAGQWFDWYN